MTDRCRWMRAFGWPTGLASCLATVGGLFWRAGKGPWVTTWPVHEVTLSLFALEWTALFFIVTVIEAGYRSPPPDDEPEPDNVEIVDPPTVNLPPFPDQFRQTRDGPFPAWSRMPALPAGITERELVDWLFDARDGKATFAARDSRKGEGGRSRGVDDDVTSNVKAFLEQWGVIDVDGSNQWTWNHPVSDSLFEALLRGEGFGVLLPPTESEV